MKSSVIVSLSLATLALAAPLRQDRRQLGLSLLSTGTVEASTVSSDPVPVVVAAQDNAPLATATNSVVVDPLATAVISSATDTAAIAQATASAVLNATELAGVAANNSTLLNSTALATNLTAATVTLPPPATGQQNIDTTVLNLAFVLEQLESKFYTAGLQAFGLQQMTAAGLSDKQARIIIETLQNVQSDEATHATTLSGAIESLGATPFTGCQFNVQPALTDPITFMAIARTLEAVGVSAYLGAAHLLTNPALLTAAGSILTLEARHQSILNAFNGGSFSPQAFDIALSPQQVLALAGGFLQGCNAQQLGLTSNEPLSITDTSSKSTRFRIGSQLAFASSITLDLNNLSCQMLVGGAPVAIVLNSGSCVVPPGIDGAVAVYLTKTNTPLQSNLITQDASIIVAGPGLIFVDSSSSSLSTLFSVSNNHGSSASADFGGHYMNGMRDTNSFYNYQRDNNRHDDSNRNRDNINVVIVKQQIEVVTQVVNEVIINNDSRTFEDNRNNDRNSNDRNSNSHDNSRNSNSHDNDRDNSNRRDRSYRYNYKQSHRNYGGTREQGWEKRTKGRDY